MKQSGGTGTGNGDLGREGFFRRGPTRLLAGADVVGVQDLVRHLDIRVPVAEADDVRQLRLAQLQQLPPIVLLIGSPQTI
jgi:hypothetical protein